MVFCTLSPLSAYSSPLTRSAAWFILKLKTMIAKTIQRALVGAFFFAFSLNASAQSLPFDFESAPTAADFVSFDGGAFAVVSNPNSGTANPSAQVAQIIRSGGQIWGGSKITLSSALDFSTNSSIEMKVYTAAPVGTVIKLKLEDAGGAFVEVDRATTVSNQWETINWDFTGAPTQFTDLVFMFDFGNLGDGSVSSTFYFDDVEQIFSGTQIDLPVNFEGSTVNYTMSDFGGNFSALEVDPTNSSNSVIRVTKPVGAATWAGTTIGTPAGFATDIPLSMTESFMTVRVWSPDAGILIRLKVEDSDDPTHTCETQVSTTVSGDWETLVFDFTNQAPGTELLSVGLAQGWTYNMASIFFNFDVDGATAGEKTYYFDDLAFGNAGLTTPEKELAGVRVFPNPAVGQWTVTAEQTIEKVELYNLQGQLLRSVDSNGSRVEIDAEDLAPGAYVLHLQSGNRGERIAVLKQ